MKSPEAQRLLSLFLFLSFLFLLLCCKSFIYSEDTILFRKSKRKHFYVTLPRWRARKTRGWEKLEGLRRVDSQREQREEALATGFTPVAACDALFSCYVLRPFRKTFAFSTSHAGIGMHTSFAGNRFPCVKSADEFPASFPPPRYGPSPSTGPHIYLCVSVASTKWCTHWDAEYIDTSRYKGEGGWLIVQQENQTVFYEQIIGDSRICNISLTFLFFLLFLNILFRRKCRSMKNSTSLTQRIDLLRKI